MTKKGALFVAIITLVTVIAWVIFDVYHARTSDTIPPDIQSAIEPLDPNFNLGAVQ